jgi:CubicO group peptidase (beta-lactamase class C family)
MSPSVSSPRRRLLFSAVIGSLVVLSLAVGGAQSGTTSPQAERQGRSREVYAPPNTPGELGIAGYAKVLCSAVFVSGRDPEEAVRNSGFFLLAEKDRPDITWKVDRAQKSVHMTLRGTVTRTAKYFGDQGCVILQQGTDNVFFKPVPVKTTLPDANTQPWPMGDVLPNRPLPREVDKQKVDAAVDAAFADPEALTAAFLVVYDGQIIAERYMPGITKDTQLECWSMGKSLTATLFALLVKDGVYKIEDPAPVEEWHKQPGDPRAKIRIVDLLRMSSGLRFIAGQDPDYTPDMGYPDHMLIYTGAIDAFKHSYTRPLQYPPNTDGRYRNSDPLTIGYLVKQAVTKRGEEYLTFPQRALFDRIGIRKHVLEVDPYGNFLMTGYDYGTARNWARIGMLYLQDGVWAGQRLLPEGWVEFVHTPAPAWKQPVYGGLFWLNGTGAFPIPKDTFYAAGGGGQNTFIIPSRKMVIVRLGHFRGAGASNPALKKALEGLMAAVEPPKRSQMH